MPIFAGDKISSNIFKVVCIIETEDTAQPTSWQSYQEKEASMKCKERGKEKGSQVLKISFFLSVSKNVNASGSIIIPTQNFSRFPR